MCKMHHQGYEVRTLGLRTEPSSSDPYLWHMAVHELNMARML